MFLLSLSNGFLRFSRMGNKKVRSITRTFQALILSALPIDVKEDKRRLRRLSFYPAPDSGHGFGVFWTISDLGRMATKNEEIYCVRSPRSVIVLI